MQSPGDAGQRREAVIEVGPVGHQEKGRTHQERDPDPGRFATDVPARQDEEGDDDRPRCHEG